MEIAEIGRQLRALRTASGRTVASVGREAGLSVPYLANLENGRGNPTLGALGQVAQAFGMRLVISFAQDGDGAGPDFAVTAPQSLVRLGRTARFRRAAELMATELGVDHRDFGPRLVNALAVLGSALGRDPSEGDWWRLLDALTLIATCPITGT